MQTTQLTLPPIACACGEMIGSHEQERVEEKLARLTEEDPAAVERIAKAILKNLPADQLNTIPCENCLSRLLGQEPAQKRLC